MMKTVRGDWCDCIRFGSSNLNADSDAYIIIACDRKYSKFTAETAPLEGFDDSDGVTFIVYGEVMVNRLLKKNILLMFRLGVGK